jgi:predicted nucleic acid-binding protein
MKLAFDTDVLIYSAAPSHPLGQWITPILQNSEYDGRRSGSVLLLPELLIKPVRILAKQEELMLLQCLSKLELIEVTTDIAALAIDFGASYNIKTPDAIHLATAVVHNADFFITNNSKDFKPSQISEIQIIFPSDLQSGHVIL